MNNAAPAAQAVVFFTGNHAPLPLRARDGSGCSSEDPSINRVNTALYHSTVLRSELWFTLMVLRYKRRNCNTSEQHCEMLLG